MQVERGVVYLVGAGPGDPGLLTLRAREILRQADCVIFDYLLHPQILDHVPDRAERIFVGKKGGAQAYGQEAINALLVQHAQPHRVVVRLKGGSLCFGRGGEEARALRAAGCPFRIVPGVTSGIAAPAYAGIPITDREVAPSVCFITGTEKPGNDRHDWEALARLPTLVVYMGVGLFPGISNSLLQHGKDPGTPVAAIRWGTWSHQQILSGELGTFAELLQKHKFGAPAIIVIGEVAASHHYLDWCQPRPLAGRTLVVAGLQRQDPLTLGLEERGARVIHCPGDPVLLPQAGSALPADLSTCDCLIFTARAAVRFFMERALAVDPDVRQFAGIKIAAIGPSCADELRAFHLRPDIMPDIHDTQHLLAALRQEVAPCRVWHPCAEGSSWQGIDALKAAGFRTLSMPMYRQEARSAVMRLTGEAVDAVCLSSPSAVRRYLNHMDPQDHQRIINENAVFFAIGSATARVMEENGLVVHQIAAEATSQSLMDTVSAYFSPSSAI